MAVKPGERRLQILQTLAQMLEHPKGEKVTTAGLAAKLDCSEAALYRHFASKAQMYEGLIEFIERSLFGVINQITGEEADGMRQVQTITGVLLNFAERNRGMTRVLIGDALVNEHERLQTRINGLLEKLEAALKQALKVAAAQGKTPSNADAAAAANLLLSYVVGRWHQYAKSGFTKTPTALWNQQIGLLVAGCINAPVGQ